MTSAHLANDEDVGESGGEAVAIGVLDVDHIKGTGVPLAVGDHPDAPQVGASRHHAEVACWEEEGGKGSEGGIGTGQGGQKYIYMLPKIGVLRKGASRARESLPISPHWGRILALLTRSEEPSPVSNLMKSVILPVCRSTWTVSLTLTRGSG